ncbi:unnamed protein product [Caenorhabditis auriculariae]|uniref:Uncharacterized protein n=1 Tax=Caenorhabditis auriculariae TaxID=2777116 RepID=A0A8S1HHX8_9PELO|nr:unnamed protein product [Caenorhabditis auriculariae]
MKKLSKASPSSSSSVQSKCSGKKIRKFLVGGLTLHLALLTAKTLLLKTSIDVELTLLVVLQLLELPHRLQRLQKPLALFRRKLNFTVVELESLIRLETLKPRLQVQKMRLNVIAAELTLHLVLLVMLRSMYRSFIDVELALHVFLRLLALQLQLQRLQKVPALLRRKLSFTVAKLGSLIRLETLKLRLQVQNMRLNVIAAELTLHLVLLVMLRSMYRNFIDVELMLLVCPQLLELPYRLQRLQKLPLHQKLGLRKVPSLLRRKLSFTVAKLGSLIRLETLKLRLARTPLCASDNAGISSDAQANAKELHRRRTHAPCFPTTTSAASSPTETPEIPSSSPSEVELHRRRTRKPHTTMRPETSSAAE